MAQSAYVYVNHTHLYNCSPPPYYLITAVLNDCYSEVPAYTAVAYSYWASFHNVPTNVTPTNDNLLQLPYKSHRIHLTNHIGSISYHITTLVITSLGGGHTHTHTNMHTDIRRQSNSKKPGMHQPAAGACLV